jgi:polyisoprenoid-binding protein YceI
MGKMRLRITLQSAMRAASLALLGVALLAAAALGAAPDKKPVDAARSKITLRVYKSGLFSPFAHDHEIEAPIESGEVNDGENPSVEIRVNAAKLRVLDPEANDETRAKVQENMLGHEVLDAQRFAEIRFRSTEVKPEGTDHWTVRGDLELHGETRPVTLDVTRKDGEYHGTAALKQTQFGITPIKIAGGAVKVKDEVKVEFSIAVAR